RRANRQRVQHRLALEGRPHTRHQTRRRRRHHHRPRHRSPPTSKTSRSRVRHTHRNKTTHPSRKRQRTHDKTTDRQSPRLDTTHSTSRRASDPAALTDNVYRTAWPSKDGPTLATKLAVVAATELEPITKLRDTPLPSKTGSPTNDADRPNTPGENGDPDTIKP